MGAPERSKKKPQLWKKAAVHFLLCFVMGFFTGFAPTNKPSIFSTNSTTLMAFSPQPIEAYHQQNMHDLKSSLPEEEETEELETRRLVIIITPTSARDEFRGVLLRRLADTLKLVAQPLLWIVVEKQSDDNEVSEILRKTGMMYRHVTFKENFTDVGSEMDHQRNVGLNHVEYHRLSGIVHFAGLSNVYDLAFFEEIRAIQGFGAWPIARLTGSRQKVVIEGPICNSSEVLGWHLKKMSNQTDAATTPETPLHISSFAFNSSILWDPERWGRAPSVKDSSQKSLGFVRKEVLEEEAKLKGIPTDGCSKVLVWDLKM